MNEKKKLFISCIFLGLLTHQLIIIHRLIFSLDKLLRLLKKIDSK
jgi:hypothetical protein